ncbi:hypothetical protein EDC52_1076 [Biostraticola tofi]|uniref:Uncharacterized protein n=1 Tax=Biostraticola tofi TaxID=466109 RepID=A0A4R3YPK7_9GAMM|nr:hypothetical protein EDC52_1076 [Biostraticola tofi]
MGRLQVKLILFTGSIQLGAKVKNTHVDYQNV